MPLTSLSSRNQAASLPRASSYIFKIDLLPKITGIYQYAEMLGFFSLFLLDFCSSTPNHSLLLVPTVLPSSAFFFFPVKIFTTQALSLREDWQRFFWIQVESRYGAICLWNKIWI